MNAVIYLEGGASGPKSKELTIRCQQAFHRLLDRMGFTGRKPRLVACGSRGNVYERFCTAHAQAGEQWVAMWIDAEEPMRDVEKSWEHLGAVTTVPKWAQPAGARDEQVLLMTTCMESWIVADPESLAVHYGQKFLKNRLPPIGGLEARSRHEVQDKLAGATEKCPNAFKKGKRSFEVLEKIDPEKFGGLPSFMRVKRILNEKLNA